VLRITPNESVDALCLKVEGKLIGPWVEELRHVCTRAGAADARCALDLTNLTFADADGVRLLQGLMSAGVRIYGATQFIQQLLQTDKQR
jgi:hypothetical protein